MGTGALLLETGRRSLFLRQRPVSTVEREYRTWRGKEGPLLVGPRRVTDGVTGGSKQDVRVLFRSSLLLLSSPRLCQDVDRVNPS